MPKNNCQEKILKLKKQLSKISDAENCREKREKLEITITAYEIMSTPAANDFLNDILEEKKKLLSQQGIFSFAQILTREQFYRNKEIIYRHKEERKELRAWKGYLPWEICDLIEEKVWELIWKEWEEPTKNSFVFFSAGWILTDVPQKSSLLIYFSKEERAGNIKQKVYGVAINTKMLSYECKEWLEINHLLLNKNQLEWIVEKKVKIKLILPNENQKKPTLLKLKRNLDKLKECNFISQFEKENERYFFLGLHNCEQFEIINLSKLEETRANQTKEIQWLLRVLRQDITLAETAPAGLREQQEFLQNHFKREFEKLHAENPQLLDRVKDLPWFKFHALNADMPEEKTKDLEVEAPPVKENEPSGTSHASDQPKTPEPTITEPTPEISPSINAENFSSTSSPEQSSKPKRIKCKVPSCFELVTNLWDEYCEKHKKLASEIPEYGLKKAGKTFDKTRDIFSEPTTKTCAVLDCSIPVCQEKKYCDYHGWEEMFDERLNAQRDKNFPNLPAENRSRYYTRIEDETEAPEMIDESETNEPEPNRPNSKGNHGDNSNESNNQEPKNNGDGENEKTGEYNKWDTIKRWFGYGTQKITRTAERINDFILENEYVRSYVEGEQWQTFRQKADKITIGVLFIIIVLAIIFVCQLIRKFFAKLFKRAEKTKKASKQEPTATKNDRKKIKKTTPPRDEKGRFIKNTQSKKKQTKIKPKANINQKNGLTPNSNYLSLNKIKTRRNSRGG